MMPHMEFEYEEDGAPARAGAPSEKLTRIEWVPGEKLLFFGIGNIARQDDGLGVRLIEKLEAAELPPEVTLEANYQLNAEDALLIADYDVVIFVDATVKAVARAPFELGPVGPAAEIAFSTHAMSVGAVIALCEQLYEKRPRTYLLTLPGYEWAISEEMSKRALHNLQQTFAAVLAWLP